MTPSDTHLQAESTSAAPLRLYAVGEDLVLEQAGRFVRLPAAVDLDTLLSAGDPVAAVRAAWDAGATVSAPDPGALRAPLQSQEVWAAGVTYYRSRTARMAESRDAGGGSFYDRVYEAERPELFFKSSAHRIAAPGTPLRIRRDSQWNVPEPELTLALDSHGHLFGYTIGNDMSSRDIEGENPLYLPQAKIYHRNASIGPCLVVATQPPGPQTTIAIEIRRGAGCVFSGETTVGAIKRPLTSLAEWLFREDRFPHGCFLMTGTGIVPPDTFTLEPGDEVRITIEPVGTLVNTIEG
jgi:2-dehydro-3-deoxy-D-arabinonate dehydratase